MGHKVIERLTESTLATLYGCCGLFDPCGDADLMSLTLEKRNPLLDWIGWELTSECLIQRNFINWIRPEVSSGVRSVGYLSDPCADPNGVEWGPCGFELRDFARLRRHGPVRDATMNAVNFCQRSPRYRLDGSPITDDREFDMLLATEVINQDLRLMLIDGNRATPGQFDGLQQLISTGYTDPEGRRCESMDSIVIDWDGNDFDDLGDAHGATWNGRAIPAGFDFFDVLFEAVRKVRQRINWAPLLSGQPPQVGDSIIVLPSFMTNCILNAFTCWQLCTSSATDTYESRQFRDNLNGGLFGAGRIFIDGFEIPLLAYDWNTINGPTRGDIYVLTGSIGNTRLISGQMLDMRGAVQGYPDAMYSYTDGGRLLTWIERDHTCVRQVVEMRPRLLLPAPWAQIRIQDVQCVTASGPLSPDPWESSFFPESSFSAATC